MLCKGAVKVGALLYRHSKGNTPKNNEINNKKRRKQNENNNQNHNKKDK